jgi:hypothetical protein
LITPCTLCKCFNNELVETMNFIILEFGFTNLGGHRAKWTALAADVCSKRL